MDLGEVVSLTGNQLFSLGHYGAAESTMKVVLSSWYGELINQKLPSDKHKSMNHALFGVSINSWGKNICVFSWYTLHYVHQRLFTENKCLLWPKTVLWEQWAWTSKVKGWTVEQLIQTLCVAPNRQATGSGDNPVVHVTTHLHVPDILNISTFDRMDHIVLVRIVHAILSRGKNRKLDVKELRFTNISSDESRKCYKT